jgi:hypothetical protein
MVKGIGNTLFRLPSHSLPTSSHELLNLSLRVPDSGTGLTGIPWDVCVFMWAALTYFLALKFHQIVEFLAHETPIET